MKKDLAGFLLILLLISPPVAYSAAPSETVKDHINKVFEVLRDPALKGESGRKIKKEKIRVDFRGDVRLHRTFEEIPRSELEQAQLRTSKKNL